MNTFAECQNCHSLNRVRSEKAMAKKSICGKCGSNLKIHGLVSEVNSKNFHYILQHFDGPVVVDFWASWCGPCKYYAPEYEKASLESAQNQKEAIFLKINTETEQELSQKYNIRGIPCTVLIQKGQEIRRQSGAMSADQVREFLGQ